MTNLNVNFTPVKDVKMSYKDMVDKYCGNMVLANELFDTLNEKCPEDFRIENGNLYSYYNQYGDEITEDQYNENIYYGFDAIQEENEVYQWYLIDGNTFDFLVNCTDELVVSFPLANAYFLGVQHYGTSWDLVNTTVSLPQ